MSSLIQVLSIERKDDEESVLRDSLRRSSLVHLTAAATNVPDALRRLQNQQIDVVVVDLGIRDLDGIALLKEVRKTRPQARVIVVTASDEAEDIFAAMDAGADAYVLQSNLSRVIEMAINSTRLGTVWLDPAIAKQVLFAIEKASQNPNTNSRVLPTGHMPIPLMPDEESILGEVTSGNCENGVCMVDPDFIKKLRRFSPARA